MQYSLEKVSTVAAYDMLLMFAQKKKQDLERKRRNLGASIDTFQKRMDHTVKESALVQLLLAAYTTAYHALPDSSKYKVNMNIKVKRLELRKARAEKKAFTYNVQSLLPKQIKYNVLDNQLSAIENYIIAVQQSRAVLNHAGLRVSNATISLCPPAQRQKPSAKRRQHHAHVYNMMTEGLSHDSPAVAASANRPSKFMLSVEKHRAG